MPRCAPGSTLGPYVIEEEIGRGGSATVFRAHDARFDAPVAVKMLAAHLAGDDESVERFVAEARALRRIDDPNVVTVFDVAATRDGCPYLVLQHADRGTLASRIETGGPAGCDELVHLVDFFERSLGSLHRRQMVHRDVKPGNVLVTGASPNALDPATRRSAHLLRHDDRLLLADLGLVKDIGASRMITRGSGSTAYAAPEQRAVVSRVDARSDLFAASAVVAEAGLGRFRRADECWSQVRGAISRDGQPAIAAALSRGLAVEPDDRPSGAAEWATELRAAIRSGVHRPVATPAPSTQPAIDLRRVEQLEVENATLRKKLAEAEQARGRQHDLVGAV